MIIIDGWFWEICINFKLVSLNYSSHNNNKVAYIICMYNERIHYIIIRREV